MPEIVKNNGVSKEEIKKNEETIDKDVNDIINDVAEKNQVVDKETILETPKVIDEEKPLEIPIVKKYEPRLSTNFLGKSAVKKQEDNTFDSIGIFKNKKNVFLMFIAPPIVISIISAVHLITFYETGNPMWMAYFLAGSIEISSIASLLVLAFLGKVNKGTIIFLFFVLLAIQMVGNMFFSFIYLQTSPYLNNLLSFFALDNTMGSIRLLSFIIGAIPVLISLGFIKSSLEYLD